MNKIQVAKIVDAADQLQDLLGGGHTIQDLLRALNLLVKDYQTVNDSENLTKAFGLIYEAALAVDKADADLDMQMISAEAKEVSQ